MADDMIIKDECVRRSPRLNEGDLPNPSGQQDERKEANN